MKENTRMKNLVSAAWSGGVSRSDCRHVMKITTLYELRAVHIMLNLLLYNFFCLRVCLHLKQLSPEVDIITVTHLNSSVERSDKQKNEVSKFINCYPNFV